MNEVKSTIESTLDANNGKITWEQMVSAIPESGRRFIWSALAELKAENKAATVARYDPERGGVHEIVRLGV